MAKIKGSAALQVTAEFTFSEAELRALDALVGYGDDAFLKAFYENLGRHYMEPHEAALRSLFESIREQVPPILHRAHEARKAFKGGA